MSPLLVDRSAGVVTLTFNRPDRRNALNLEMLHQFCSELEQIVADESLRALVLRGAGSDFTSGFDLIEGGEEEKSLEHGRLLVQAQLLLSEAPQVTIAAVDGFALAGGGALIATCDFAFSTRGAKFGYPVLKVGIVPTPGMPFLRHEIGERHLRDLVLSGDLKDGNWAEQTGLVTRCYETFDEVLAESSRISASILASSPTAVQATKRFANELVRAEIKNEMEEALRIFQEVRRGREAQEGLQAFAEKRPPSWAER